MAKKVISWKTKGMNRDLSVSAFNPEFAFENMNLRLSTNEGNTLMSWVNEKGTASIKLVSGNWADNSSTSTSTTQLSGTPIGTAIINHKLVIFTTDTSADYIYVLKYADNAKTSMLCKVLYEGNLDFSIDYPLETLVSYESEDVQKVYWTDGKNQPRVINIEGTIKPNNNTQFDFVPELQLRENIAIEKQLGGNGMFAPGVIQYAFTYYRKNGQESNIFYTSPLLYISHKDRGASPEDKVENAFKITVKNVDKNFDYLRIYSIQRTSVNATPICKRIQDVYIDDSYDSVIEEDYAYSNTTPTVTKNGTAIGPSIQGADRIIFGSTVRCIGYSRDNIEVNVGGNAVTFGSSATSSSMIWITVNKITHNGITAFYVVESPSSDNDGRTEPLNVGSNHILYIDTGLSGDSIDPTELLYKGGESITAQTIEQKDNTLFLGNIAIDRKRIVDTLKNKVSASITLYSDQTRSILPQFVSSGHYSYYNQLTSKGNESRHANRTVPCGGFKTGDWYRCGVQFQYKTGKWSDPIWVGDKQVKSKFVDNSNSVTLPIIKGSIGASAVSDLVNAGYRKIRPVVVFPKLMDRTVICQGVIAPTVYTQNNRNDESCFAQSSWFFRPMASDDSEPANAAVVMSPKSNGTLRYTSRQINNQFPERKNVFNPKYIRQVEIEGDYFEDSAEGGGNKFNIDRGHRTFHSPDIEFDEQISLIDFTGKYYKQRGVVDFKYTMSDIDIQTETPPISSSGSGFIHKPFSSTGPKGIVAGLFYDDYLVDDDLGDDKHLAAYPNQKQSCKFLVYPWQCSGYLNNDMNRPTNKGTGSAKLKKKVLSNLRYATTNLYNFEDSLGNLFSTPPQIFNSNEVSILKFDNHLYKGNIDTMITPDASDGSYFCFNGLKVVYAGIADIAWWDFTDAKTPFNSTAWCKTFNKDPNNQNENGLRKWNGSTEWSWFGDHIGDDFIDIAIKKFPVRMKYKSTPHLFANFNSQSESYYQLSVVEISQDISEQTRFGGTSDDALRENTWVPCGEPVYLETISGQGSLEFFYDYGDTYFQRYDCLKTYPFTREDINQIVEIGSFMLESRVNIDGRYDRNRGQANNLNMSPTNFNLMNPVYSQIDNFFSYKIQPKDYYEDNCFPNQITWSKTKTSGADVDMWTNVTLASMLELDGNKGQVSSLQRLNDSLVCFQDSGISQILYNENVQIASTAGVPIEIANSEKVQGKRYISDTIGCSNKWSITSGVNGIYFMDSNHKSIYIFNGQLNDLSNVAGFNSWSKMHIPSSQTKWNPTFPESIEGKSAFISYFDRINQEVLFINNNKTLAYSEKYQVFTSFYNYENTPFFCNLDDTGIWVKSNQLWKHRAGQYCKFFGVDKPYWMTLVGNPEPTLDKIFTNLEFRACVEGEGTGTDGGNGDVFDNTFDYTFHPEGGGIVPSKYVPYLPFDYLETWNEYQHGISYLENRNGHSLSLHHTGLRSALNRKFRIWRCDVPCNNYPMSKTTQGVFTPESDSERGIYRKAVRPRDRMRNPWIYLTLMKKVDESASESLPKAEIHDLAMTYYT